MKRKQSGLIRNRWEQDVSKKTYSMEFARVATFITSESQIDNPYPFCTRPIEAISMTSLKTLVRSLDVDILIAQLTAELTARDRFEWSHAATRGGVQTHADLFDNPQGPMKQLHHLLAEAVSNYFRENEDSAEIFQGMALKSQIGCLVC